MTRIIGPKGAVRMWVLIAGLCGLVVGLDRSALGQDTAAAPAAESTLADIIVTARKREESIMKAPVIMEAVPIQTIQDLHVTSAESLTSVEPSLKINFGFSLSGITINMRGLGNGPAANFLDQSVALNLDGFTSNSGQLFRIGLFDMQQIEILKGPQALFYGKSTSAGLIAIHSADPTDKWESKVTAGYEFEAHETDVDGYISGPITDELGIRFAGFRNTSTQGWLTNPNPDNPNSNLPQYTNEGARLTLKYDNVDAGLRINLKGSITRDTGNWWVGDLNESRCPAGGNPVPILSTYDPCKLGTVTQGNPPPLPYIPGLDYSNPFSTVFSSAGPLPMFRSTSYNYTNSDLGILNIDYDLRSGLTLSSVTGVVAVEAADVGGSSTLGSPDGYQLGGVSSSHEFSQELRLTSDWRDSWFNFMAGGLYNPSTRNDELGIDFRGAGYTLWTDSSSRMKAETHSAFGQILLTPFQKWELDAGLRYIHVNKHFESLIANNNYTLFYEFLGFPPPVTGQGIQNVPEANKAITENETVPEGRVQGTRVCHRAHRTLVQRLYDFAQRCHSRREGQGL
jgi:iron complex outermembrane recepter protein